MFNLGEYLNELVVEEGDEELTRAMECIELIQLICDDPWLSRQAHFGLAGAMERQLEYLGTTLLPNTEARIAQAHSGGVSAESYTQDSWFGSSNADQPHISDENPTQTIDDNELFKDQLVTRMRTAAIVFVTNVRAHDSISVDLNQFSYGQIKAKAKSNQDARDKAMQRKANTKPKARKRKVG